MLQEQSSPESNATLWRLLDPKELQELIQSEDDVKVFLDLAQNCNQMQLSSLLQTLKEPQRSKLDLAIVSKQIIPVKRSFDEFENDHK